MSDLVEVVDSRGRTLTPCRRKVAEKEVRLARAKWLGRNKIRLRFDPFAYRYIRLKVLSRDNYICYWCKRPGDTMDHVIPWSRGGRTSMTNCICACEECNGTRGDMPVDQFAKLMKVPPPRPVANQPTGGAVSALAIASAPEIAAAPLAAPMPIPGARPKAAPRPVSREIHEAVYRLLDQDHPPLARRLFL